MPGDGMLNRGSPKFELAVCPDLIDPRSAFTIIFSSPLPTAWSSLSTDPVAAEGLSPETVSWRLTLLFLLHLAPPHSTAMLALPSIHSPFIGLLLATMATARTMTVCTPFFACRRTVTNSRFTDNGCPFTIWYVQCEHVSSLAPCC
jgi:hypothetical protein